MSRIPTITQEIARRITITLAAYLSDAKIVSVNATRRVVIRGMSGN